MSSQRVQKLFDAMPDQIRKLGAYQTDYRAAMKWQGRVDSSNALLAGRDACVIDFTATAWATQNLRAIIVAETADYGQGLQTQSHSLGNQIDGGVALHVYMETPTTWVSDLAKFQRDVIQHLRGQLSAPVQLHLCPATDEPTVQDVNGALASETYVDSEFMLPYFTAVPGGI